MFSLLPFINKSALEIFKLLGQPPKFSSDSHNHGYIHVSVSVAASVNLSHKLSLCHFSCQFKRMTARCETEADKANACFFGCSELTSFSLN